MTVCFYCGALWRNTMGRLVRIRSCPLCRARRGSDHHMEAGNN